jgi:hypothetical protein
MANCKSVRHASVALPVRAMRDPQQGEPDRRGAVSIEEANLFKHEAARTETS